MNNDPDPKLSKVLGSWQVSPSPDSDFNRQVWQRIASVEAQVAVGFWSTLGQWLLSHLPKPAYATLLLVATAILGTTAANLHADRLREQYRLESARRYLASIDPLTMMTTTAARIGQ